MIPIDLLEDYLIDQEEGIKKFLTLFLNLVMQLEAIQQSGSVVGLNQFRNITKSKNCWYVFVLQMKESVNLFYPY